MWPDHFLDATWQRDGRLRMVPSPRLAARLFELSHAQLHEIAVARCEALLASPQAQVGRTISSTRRGNAMERLRMVPSSRLAVRLFELSHAQLLEIAVAGCEASPEVTNQAEAILAANKPLAQRLVEGVLLSNDLAPHVLAPLPLEDGAAAAVCSLWADGWKATSEGRRRLTRVAFDLPADVLMFYGMAAIPGDDEKLVVCSGSTVIILDRSMSVVARFTDVLTDAYADNGYTGVSGRITADEQSIYISEVEGPQGQGTLGDRLRLTHDGTELARYTAPDGFGPSDGNAGEGYCPVLAPGGLLFCIHFAYEETVNGDRTWDEIIALDAHSMQLRYRFGKSLFGSEWGGSACGLAVIGEELFVCDMWNDRLQVFSLAGEHRRSITGEWMRPVAVCFVKDRLYLIEEDYNTSLIEEADKDADEDGELIHPLQGRRIFALSLQGDTLQVYTNSVEGQTFGETLCCFDGKLLAPVVDNAHKIVGVMALAGA